MATFETIYFVIALVFIIWQGPLYFKWHPRSFNFCSTEYWKELLLNTLGSIIGWILGYYIIFYRLSGGLDKFEPKFSDLVIFLIAFYGINGNLPNILFNKLKLER